MDRHNRRVAVLEVCRAMIDGRCAAHADVGMGCASPYAYETALRLLEIEEEIAGACLPRQTSQVITWNINSTLPHLLDIVAAYISRVVQCSHCVLLLSAELHGSNKLCSGHM